MFYHSFWVSLTTAYHNIRVIRSTWGEVPVILRIVHLVIGQSLIRPPIVPAAQALTSKPPGSVDLDAAGDINGHPTIEFPIESLEDKDRPWNRPGGACVSCFIYSFRVCFWHDCNTESTVNTGTVNMYSYSYSYTCNYHVYRRGYHWLLQLRIHWTDVAPVRQQAARSAETIRRPSLNWTCMYSYCTVHILYVQYNTCSILLSSEP